MHKSTTSKDLRNKQIVDLRRQGLTFQQISDKTGVSRAYANIIVKSLAPELLTRPRPIANAEQVVTLREQGFALHEIVDQLKTSVNYGYRILRRLRPPLAALTLRDLGLSEEDLQENDLLRPLLELRRPVLARNMAQRYLAFKSLAEKGFSPEEAAEETGFGLKCVNSYAHKYGIEFTRRKGWAKRKGKTSITYRHSGE